MSLGDGDVPFTEAWALIDMTACQSVIAAVPLRGVSGLNTAPARIFVARLRRPS